MLMITRILFIPLLLLVLLVPPAVSQNSTDPSQRWKIEPALEYRPHPFPLLLRHASPKRPRIGLVLSGGGARGIASIGVLRAFEKANIPVDFIVGTSVGSIIGGLYAAGYSVDDLVALSDSTNWQEILSLTEETRRSDLFYDQKLARDKSLLVLRFDGFEPVLPEAFSSGQRLTLYLNILALQGIYHPSPSFDDLRIPFRAVATDLISGKRIVLDRGDLSEALRASVSVPLLFSPVVRDSTELLDGGLVSNIPADIARNWGADIVVVVDVTSPLRGAAELNTPWGVADQIIGIAMQQANQQQLKIADYVVRPRLGEHLSTDFVGLDSLIRLGEEATEGLIGSLRRDLLKVWNPGGRPDSIPTELVNPTIVLDGAQRSDPVYAALRELEGKSVSAEDVRQALRIMYDTGEIAEAKVIVESTPEKTLLLPAVRPNPVLTDVIFQGNKLVPSDTLQAIARPLLNKRINVHNCCGLFEDILRMYRREGYSLARIVSADFDSSTGIATIALDEGIVHRRTIFGTKKTKDYVIWRELPWSQGDAFDIHLVTAGLNNLYGTNLFEQVSLNVRREGEGLDRQVVMINARERSTDLIRLGLMVNNERNVQPSVDMRDENFLGIASETGIHFFGGLRNRSYFWEFKANRIFNSYLTFDFKAFYQLKDINVFKDDPNNRPTRWNRVRDGEFREVREGVSLTFGTQLERLGQVTIEGRTEHQRVWSIFNQPLSSQSFHVSSVKIGTRVDSRDRFPYPREGVMMEFSYESGLVKTTDRLGFTKLSFDYASYRTFFGTQTISPRVRFGFGDETVPITEMFTLGGQESFYGFREDDARGRQLLALSLEYRYHLPIRILFDTYFKLRYDLGHIWQEAEQIRLKDMRHGVGIALGLDTPIGATEISVGRAFFIRKDLFDSPLSYGPLVAYFTMGYAF